jgi:hypothetical protein
MKKTFFLKIATALSLAGLCDPLLAHDHMPAAATSSAPGATLQYDPSATDYTTRSGFVFALTAGTTNDPYLGYYYTDDQIFDALAATLDSGGPVPGHAALGTYVQVKLLSMEGPAGASFGFWEALEDGVDSTNLTWSVTVPYHNGTNLIHVSESDGSPGSDPYGHIHGRIYSVTKPGFYIATWQFVDTSTNGADGGSVDLPSVPFSTYYQAGLTIAVISIDTNGVNITFAAPSHQPDDLSTPPANYILQSSSAPGSSAVWQTVGGVIVGDDALHTVTLPLSGAAQFFRLGSDFAGG